MGHPAVTCGQLFSHVLKETERRCYSKQIYFIDQVHTHSWTSTMPHNIYTPPPSYFAELVFGRATLTFSSFTLLSSRSLNRSPKSSK